MIFDDAFSLRECLIALQGFGLGVILMALLSVLFARGEPQDQARDWDHPRPTYDPHAAAFADSDHFTGFRKQFWR